MARLIVKSPYIKCGGGQGADGYMRYIATRERVEIIPDDRPPTRKQEQLITKLTKDFPDVKGLLEYEDYTAHPTKANASSLITLALEEHWKQVQQTDGYMQYIATRPRAERLGDHGLFGDADHVDLDAAMSELEHYTGNVWTHILSLHREDAERLGYNNAQAWRALLRAHHNDIAAAMHFHVSYIFQHNAAAVTAQPRLHIDCKQMQELQKLRIALGHQPDNHEEEQTRSRGGMTMKGW